MIHHLKVDLLTAHLSRVLKTKQPAGRVFFHLPRYLVFVGVAYSSTSNGVDCVSGGDVGSNGCVDGLELVA